MRVAELLAHVKSEHENKNILFVTHGTTASELIKILANKQEKTRLNNAEVMLFEI